MKKKKRIIRVLLPWLISAALIAALVIFVGIPLYGTPETVNEYPPDIFFTEGGKSPVVMQNEALRFELDPATTYFTLTDKVTGQTWDSVPADAPQDPRATSGSTRDMLSATLMVGYTNSQGTVEIDNYGYAIKNGNFLVEQREDGSVAVRYAVGKISRVYYIPTAITKERMDTFLSAMKKADKKKIESNYTLIKPEKLDGRKDKDDLLAKYPSIAEQPLYILKSDVKDNNKSKMEELFRAAGYTMEEYEADMELVEGSEDSTSGPVFNVTMVYRLSGNDLVVEVPYESLRYRQDYPITSLTVLPMFGAVHESMSGELLVPEGGGALIHCNNGRVTQNSYFANVYGWDYATDRKEVVSETRVAFPVFGIALQDSSFVCMVEGASAYASVQADISGRNSSYNTANAKYVVLHSDQYNVSAKTARLVYMYEQELPMDTIVQRYRFVQSGSYFDMARAYGEYLQDKTPRMAHGTSSEDMPVSLELIGAIDKKVVKFGLPVDSVVATTSFAQAQDIIADLAGQGIRSLQVRFNGWANGGVNQKVMTGMHVVRQIGGEAGMKALIAKAASLNVPLYFDGISCFALKSDVFDGFISFRDAARLTTREQVKINPYSIPLFIQSDWLDPFYLVKGGYADKAATNLRTGLVRLGAGGVGYRDLGFLLSSDFTAGKTYTRQKVKAMNVAQLEASREAGLAVAVRYGNDYALNSADLITDMDLDGQNYGLLDEHVPFYQIAIHGMQDYTGKAINLAGSWKQELLTCAEYGSGLHFVFMAEDTQVLQDSLHSAYYGAYYTAWRDTVKAAALQYQQDMAGLNRQHIVSHVTLAKGVKATGYEDGTVVYVNYTGKDCTVSGVTVPAESYVVERSSK